MEEQPVTLYLLIWDFLSCLKLIYGPQQHEVAQNYIVNNFKYIISPSIPKSMIGWHKHIEHLKLASPTKTNGTLYSLIGDFGKSENKIRP